MRKFYWNSFGKSLNWEFIREQRERIIFVYVRGRYQMAGKKQNLDPMWKTFMKEVDLGEPSSFFDHVIWVALKENANRQRYCGQLQRFV